ncbi:MAG TPA: septum formation initiator family protein [Streptosporangiaceae bacterium]|nr:septum formation initiator family protein [Streptosporangiaceae bacterium]
MDGASGSGPRAPARLTGRAAVLAVVVCAIALSLAYPVREYVAQRKQIDQLVAEQQMMVNQVRDLIAQQARLTDKGYIEHVAGSELHMCMPNAQCYVVQEGQSVLTTPRERQQPSAPWYAKLWQSVEQANKLPAK